MKRKILLLFVLVAVLAQGTTFARGHSKRSRISQIQQPPIQKIAVVSMVDDTMCVYKTKKGFLFNKALLEKVPFYCAKDLNTIVEDLSEEELKEKYEVVSLENKESRLRLCPFPGMKDFWKNQGNCSAIYQMVQESQVDAILFIYPFLKRDMTRENTPYIHNGGFVGGVISGMISEATTSRYMTAPELLDNLVMLDMKVGLVDVRGWKNGNTSIRPKEISCRDLNFSARYRKDRISSTEYPTVNDQKTLCEVVRLCLSKRAAKVLALMKI